MKTLQEKKIEKLEEYIEILEGGLLRYDLNNPRFVRARDELAALDKEIEQGEEEPNDAHLLQNIYDRNSMDLIVQSDIYLRGFEDGLGYNKAKKHGGMGSCPECGNSVYNCKCQ